MASLYILILMTSSAKLPLSLQQVPQFHSSPQKTHSTSTIQQRRAIKTANEEEEKNDIKSGGVLESQPSLANKFLSHFPRLEHGSIFFPPLRKRLTFVWSLWEVGIRNRTMGLPTVRGWEEPSQISQPGDWLIRPLSLPSHRPHINTFTPHCPPPSCSGICSPQQPVLSTTVRAEVSHWQFAPNRFVRASNCTAPTCGSVGLSPGSVFYYGTVLWRSPVSVHGLRKCVDLKMTKKWERCPLSPLQYTFINRCVTWVSPVVEEVNSST